MVINAVTDCYPHSCHLAVTFSQTRLLFNDVTYDEVTTLLYVVVIRSDQD